MASQRLAGTTIDGGATGSIRIDGVRLSSTGRRLVVATTLGASGPGGSIKGTLYLIGRPRYDLATGVLSIDDLDYDIATRNLLAKTANWVLRSKLLEKARAAAHFSLTGAIEAQRVALNRLLAGTDLTPNARLSGNLATLALAGVYVGDTAISVDIDASGHAAVQIHP